MDTSDSTTVPDGYKRCTKCGQVKPATYEFFCWRKETNNWRSECRQCKCEGKRRYYAANPEKQRESNKHWRDSNLEKKRRIDRQYRNSNPDKVRTNIKRWRHLNPDKDRVNTQRRRSLKRSLPHTFTEQDWQRALEYFHGCCAYCGNPPSLFDYNIVLHQEHHIPVIKGGGYTPDNILPACQSCNLSKGDKDVHIWLIERFGKKQTRGIEQRIQWYFENLSNK